MADIRHDITFEKIKEILSGSEYDRKTSLIGQRKFLLLKFESLNGLIDLLNKSLKEQKMSFKEFSMDDVNAAKQKYQKEVKARWDKITPTPRTRGEPKRCMRQTSVF